MSDNIPLDEFTVIERLDAGLPPSSPAEAEARAPYERLFARIRDLPDIEPPPGWRDRPWPVGCPPALMSSETARADRTGSAPPLRCCLEQNTALMRRAAERCGDCTPGELCAPDQACATQRDAALAAELGAAWAVFVRGQLDIRKPWPSYSGRAAAIALRLVEALAVEPRRSELARICHWRAGLRWESLELPRLRDRPYDSGNGEGAIVQLSGSALSIRFRTRRMRGRAPVEHFSAADAPWSRRRGGNGH